MHRIICLILVVCSLFAAAQEAKPLAPGLPAKLLGAQPGALAKESSVQPEASVKEDPAVATPYRFFNLVSEENLTAKLNQYGALGYRFIAKSVAEGGATQVVMETSPEGPREYAFASAPVFKHKLEESMNEWGAKGFRYVPLTLRMAIAGKLLSAPVYSVLMEKVGEGRCEYRTVMPILQGNVKKDMAAALTEGFRPVAATKQDEENIIIMERCASNPKIDADSAADMYRVIGFSNMKERDRKIGESAAEGYRIIESRFSYVRRKDSPEFVMLLERAKDRFEYKYLVNDYKLPKQGEMPKDQPAEFEKQLNEAAHDGYRLSARPVARLHFTGWATMWSELSALLEKTPGKYEYRVVEEQDTPALSHRLTELRAQGFRILPMGLLGNDIAVVERAIPNVADSK